MRNAALLLTPPGVAALAVVRVAGPGVGRFLQEHFSRPTPPGQLVHGVLTDADSAIDDPVVTVSPDGDSADLCLHGGEWIVTRTLRLLAARGFAPIESDADGVLPEFAVDPIDPGDAVERSVLRHLPLATTDLGAETLLRQIDLWRDFDPTPDLAAAVAGDESLWHLLHPPTVAIVGWPNVGKSTLANRLTGRPTSIVADGPGTTRDWVGATANLDGLPVTLIDTPGLRETADPIERAAIDASRPVAGSSDLVIVVDDGTPDAAEGGTAGRTIRFRNKSDRPGVRPPDDPDALAGSALTGEGVDALVDRVRSHFGVGVAGDDRPRWWTVEQRAWLRGRVSAE